MTTFYNEYKQAVNNILKDVYGNTDYWGKGERGNYGIIKPLNNNDDETWSNYNFINTHWSVRDNIVEPFIRENGFNSEIEPNKSYKDSENNREYFRIMWLNRDELFGPNSPLVDKIINDINRTRKHGQKRETSIGEILNKLPFLDVEIRGAADSSEDFSGTDAIVNYKGKDYTSQIKPFTSYSKVGNTYVVTTHLERKYKQNLYIFSKTSGDEYHIMVFWNRDNQINGDTIVFGIGDLFLGVNYVKSTNKLRYKING